MALSLASPTRQGIPPPQTPPPSAPSVLGIPVPFHLRLEHCHRVLVLTPQLEPANFLKLFRFFSLPAVFVKCSL